MRQKIVSHAGDSWLLRWADLPDFTLVWVDRMNLYAENGLVDYSFIHISGHCPELEDRAIPSYLRRVCARILATSTAVKP